MPASDPSGATSTYGVPSSIIAVPGLITNCSCASACSSDGKPTLSARIDASMRACGAGMSSCVAGWMLGCCSGDEGFGMAGSGRMSGRGQIGRWRVRFSTGGARGFKRDPGKAATERSTRYDIMATASLRLRLLAAAFALAVASPLAAQPRRAASKPVPAPSIAGTWTGTATVPLGDSAIVVPVFYTFAEGAGGITGTAMVPGQGAGPISNVVRDGAAVRFRVTVKQGEKQGWLDHDGKLGADGAIEGIVNLDSKPVAKFRILPKK
jgi:hypothetical protein